MLRMFVRKPLATVRYHPQATSVRSLWEYVNMMFNKPDPERIKQVGPDRACAEWVLRNGGSVRWEDGGLQSDYNALPPEGVRRVLAEIDGSNSSISHYGFPHLGCTQLKKIILHNNGYIDDRALEGLSYGKDTLTHVQVSKCPNVTDNGVKKLKILRNLHTLTLFDLEGVSNLKECEHFLKSELPHCKVSTEPIKT